MNKDDHLIEKQQQDLMQIIDETEKIIREVGDRDISIEGVYAHYDEKIEEFKIYHAKFPMTTFLNSMIEHATNSTNQFIQSTYKKIKNGGTFK